MKRNGFGKLIFGALLLAVMLLVLPSAALADGEEFTVTTSVSGGYTYADGVLTINKGGSYTIGMADGVTQTTHKISVNLQGVYNDTKSITLTLSKLNMITDKGDNITFEYCNQETEVNIVIDGDNTITNTCISPRNTEGYCIRARANFSDTTVKGSGKLTLTAADDYPSWNSKTFTVDSEDVVLDFKSHAIMATEGIYIKSGKVDIVSSESCIYTNGEFLMTGGNLKATSTAGNYCIQINDVADTTTMKGAGLEIRGGDVTLTTTGTEQSYGPIFLNLSKREKSIVINTTGTVTLENKGKGVSGIFFLGSKAKNFTMAGGKLIIKGYPRGIWRYAGSSGGLNFNGGETEIICTTPSAIYGVGHSTNGGSHTTDWASTYKHKNYVGTADKPEEVPDSSVVNNSSSKYKYLLITPAYDIEYELNSGIVLPPDANPATYSRVDKFTLTNPTRYLYNFSGWTGSNGTTPQTEVTIDGSVATGKRTYTANWDGQPFTVYFFSNFEPGTYQTQTFKYGEEKALNANPFTREGYDFIGWNTVGQPTSDNPGTSYADKGNLLINTALDENQLKLWAQWRIRSHTISYAYSNSAPDGAPAVPASATVAYGSGQTVAAAPTLIGYTFSGWSGKTKTDGAALTVDANNAFTMPDDDVEFTGAWTANTYTVTLVTNGGAINSGNVTGYTYGVGATLPADVTQTGHTFLGWFDNEGLTGTPVTAISTEETGDKEFWAKWTPIAYAIIVTDSANGSVAVKAGETADATTAFMDDTVTLTLTPDTGYELLTLTVDGEDKTGEISGNVYSFTMPAHDVTVTVTYTSVPIATHTLTINYVYEDNRPAAETHIETLTEGAEYAVASPAIEGFTPDQGTVSGTMGTADVTVTVTYTANPIATHTLTINYVYEDNRPAAETHIETLTEGAEYAVASPAIEGFTPDQGTVAGTMGTADVIVTVTYTANPKPVIYYSVVEGNGQTYVRRSNVPLEFKVVRNIDDEKAYGLFRALKRDGTAVAEQYFTKEPGSVIVTLTPEYLEGLVLGEHTLTFVFEDGEAEAHFFVKPVPGSFEDVAIPSNTFTFRKVWEGGSEKSIDFTLYKLGGTVYHHGFNKKIINKSEWQYNAWFSEAAACYVIEEPVEGYKTRYENVGVYAGITDRCCDGGTIVNYKVPKTGDDANPFLWVGCVLVGLTIISVSAYAGKRKKAHSK